MAFKMSMEMAEGSVNFLKRDDIEVMYSSDKSKGRVVGRFALNQSRVLV
jgi:hypothetical protein